MSDQGVFDDENKPNPEATPPVNQGNPFADQLGSILNDEGKPKYETVEKALEALNASQDFIKTLKTEKQELENKYTAVEQELAKRANIEDFVNRLSGTPNEPKPNEETPPVKDAISVESVEEMFQKQFEQREQQSRQQANLDRVVSELSKTHGDQANAVVREKAKELNTTTEKLQELARENPDMALRLLADGTSSSSSTQFTQHNSPNNEPEVEMPKFEKSLTRGGVTNQELAKAWKEVGEYTQKKLGIE